jgi:TonB family protein
VTNVHAIKGDPLLREAVEDVVREWKFKPVMIGDKATQVFARATFDFVLSDGIQTANGIPGEIGPATETPTRVRISSGVSTGLIVRKVNPAYPEEARRARIQGTVLLRAVIDREGAISDLQYISGPNELVESAVDAVRQWRYKPYLLMGSPVEVETQIQINFTLTPR